jgi:hypothetical protein
MLCRRKIRLRRRDASRRIGERFARGLRFAPLVGKAANFPQSSSPTHLQTTRVRKQRLE